jgi:hypothetical protein
MVSLPTDNWLRTVLPKAIIPSFDAYSMQNLQRCKIDTPKERMEENAIVQYITILDIIHLVRFEVFTAVTMKYGVFWDVTRCGSCKNRRFGET